MRQKGPRPIGAARENWVAPFREGIQLYLSIFPHDPSLYSIKQNGNGTGKSGELCSNPRVRSLHGDMSQVDLQKFYNASLIRNIWEIQQLQSTPCEHCKTKAFLQRQTYHENWPRLSAIKGSWCIYKPTKCEK